MRTPRFPAPPSDGSAPTRPIPVPFDDLREEPDPEDLAARRAARSPWSWAPARLWTCARCLGTWLLRELRCPRCGAREDA